MSWEVHQSQDKDGTTLGVEMAALASAIQTAFLMFLLMMENSRAPAGRVWAALKRKACTSCATAETADGDIEAGALADSEDSDDDAADGEIQPLLLLRNRAGGAAEGDVATRVAALETVLRAHATVLRENATVLRENSMLHAKVRGLDTLVRTLYNGGEAITAAEDSVATMWSPAMTQLNVDFSGGGDEDGDALGERGFLGTGLYERTTAPNTMRPTWMRTLEGGELVHLFSLAGRWLIGVSGKEALARSSRKTVDAAPTEVAAWQVRIDGVWRDSSSLTVTAPNLGLCAKLFKKPAAGLPAAAKSGGADVRNPLRPPQAQKGGVEMVGTAHASLGDARSASDASLGDARSLPSSESPHALLGDARSASELPSTAVLRSDQKPLPPLRNLPAGWTAHASEDGNKTYFHHAPSKKTSWIHPKHLHELPEGWNALQDDSGKVRHLFTARRALQHTLTPALYTLPTHPPPAHRSTSTTTLRAQPAGTSRRCEQRESLPPTYEEAERKPGRSAM